MVMAEMPIYDYVIVGAGSAGCVLASRLSADPSVRVLLLEAGGSDRHLLIDLPKGIAKLMTHPRYTWSFPVRQARQPGRESKEVWRRGRVIGGSSSVNGMIYSRGHYLDYEDWAAAAGPDWGWDAMRAAYRAIEDHELGPTEYRGQGGPLHISPGTFRYPLAERMIAAGEELGLLRREDLNHPDLEGVGYYSHTIRHGRRQSAAKAFLEPVLNRPNLTVRTGVVVTKVESDQGRITAVTGRSGRELVSFGAREVILSAGTILSPKLLQLSGIGPSGLLRSLGIDVVADRPEVGENLREHLAVSLSFRLEGQTGLNHRYQGIGLVPGFAQYYLFHTGPMATGPYEVGAFARSQPDRDRPDMQIYLSAHSRRPGAYKPEKLPGLTIYGQLVQTTSAGRLALTSADPDSELLIEPNWLQTEADQQAAVAMVRYMRRYVRQSALKECVGEETAPGEASQSDQQLLSTIREIASSGLHAVGTCAMGRGPDSVVDNRLRVRGVRGLRVVDCSVMPGLISGNTNGPAMALAWRAADLILEDRSRA